MVAIRTTITHRNQRGAREQRWYKPGLVYPELASPRDGDGRMMGVIGFLGGEVVGTVTQLILGLMRLVMFALALGLTLISYQAYSERGTKRLESAFIGFAFISMGMGVSALNSQMLIGSASQASNIVFMAFQIVETIPFILGLGMLYVSLYR